ncbi:MAG: hypothetical protein KJP04_04920 [Arenicella sp.]|nr:hypothetical protein [Arenicella sp.]
MYKLAFFVPEQHLESVKAAVFAAGAGQIGDYDQCAWQTLGRGQYRPLAGSQPYIGQRVDEGAGDLHMVAEYRVEMVCHDGNITAALHALVSAHPYEEPAYDVWKLADIKPCSPEPESSVPS